VARPDGDWSILLVNKDSANAHKVKIEFAKDGAKTIQEFAGRASVTTFGAEQYVWHPEGAKSHADPDGPPAESSVEAKPNMQFNLPRASITVIRGKIR
jgi:hypothetical protein